MRRSVQALLAIMLVVGLLAGCGGGGTNESQSNAGSGNTGTNTGNTGGEGGEQPAAEGTPMKDGKYDPPITITVARGLGGDVKFRDGEDIQNNVHNKWALDEFGIKFHYDFSMADVNGAFENKVRLMLSANEKFPDIMRIGDRQLVQDLISSGRFMAVDEAIEKYASDRLKQLWKDHPEGFYQVTRDGKRYGLPVYTQGNGSDEMIWIRQDWLDKLGLQAPKTLDELEKIMDAFVNQDPDGNGKKDTVALAASLKNGMGTWMSSTSFLIGAYGGKATDHQWGKAEDGTLYYGSTAEPVKKALAKLNEWYKKGYLEKEVGINDETKASEAFTKGKAGIFPAPAWAATWPIPDLLKLDPNAKVTPLPVISGPDGSIGRFGEQTVQAAILFSKDFKHMDAYLKYLDTIYGVNFGDERWADGIFEGYDYVKKDGKVVTDDASIPGGRVYPDKYFVGTYHAVDIPFLQYEVFDKLAGGAEPSNPVEKRLAGQDPLYIKGGAIVNQQNQYRMANLFYGAPTETMSSKNEYLNKLENETFTKIVYGQLPIDAFDKFVADWKKGGGDEITKEVNDWYQSVGGQ